VAVLIECISVVVSVDVVQTRHPGGLDGYRDACPNGTFCSDGKLTRVGFMSQTDVKSFVDSLERHGLTFFEDGEFRDVAVVDQTRGPTGPCRWIAFEAGSDGPSYAWVSGSEPGSVAAPEGWVYERSMSAKGRFISPDEGHRDFKYSRTDGANDVYIDRRTGKEHFVGRTDRSATPPAAGASKPRSTPNRFGAILAEALSLESAANQARECDDREELIRVFTGLEKLVTEISALDPGAGTMHTHAAYLQGVLLRILLRWQAAEQVLRDCLKGAPDYPSAWIELTWCLSEQGRLEEAEEAARRSIKLLPQSPASWGNLAGVLVEQGRKVEAREALDTALGFDPNDKKLRYVDKNFEALIKDTNRAE
jgi:hypothetical protein